MRHYGGIIMNTATAYKISSGRGLELLPREKLEHSGVKALSDRELVALLLGRGTKGHQVMKVSTEVLALLDRSGNEPPGQALQSIAGVGKAKAASVQAAFELARRRIRPEGVKVSVPTDILPLVGHLNDRRQEYFLSISLSGAHEVIAVRVVTIGLVDRATVHPREVFADVITDRASALVVAHNHPSGTLQPSREDEQVTAQIASAGEMLGIMLLDHVIFSKKGYYSFQEHGKIAVRVEGHGNILSNCWHR